MVYVPGSTFEMGSLPDDDQFGPYTVTLDGVWIDQTEVTNAQTGLPQPTGRQIHPREETGPVIERTP